MSMWVNGPLGCYRPACSTAIQSISGLTKPNSQLGFPFRKMLRWPLGVLGWRSGGHSVVQTGRKQEWATETDYHRKIYGAQPVACLSALMKMPAYDVELRDARNKNLLTFSTATRSRLDVSDRSNRGVPVHPSSSEVVGLADSWLQNQTPAARVDSTSGYPWRNSIYITEERIERWQELPRAKQPQPLSVPGSKSKEKRGGCRIRKEDEKHAVTDAANIEWNLADLRV